MTQIMLKGHNEPLKDSVLESFKLSCEHIMPRGHNPKDDAYGHNLKDYAYGYNPWDCAYGHNPKDYAHGFIKFNILFL